MFGDYDVDGITATVILVDYLKSRGVDVLHYIPRRIEDGYGLGQDAIRSLHEQGVSLLITVDCGITGVEEVDFAASLGMDVVITDHHECKDTLPRAVAVVDPTGRTAPIPSYLAGCGVALKLVLALGGESQGGPFLPLLHLGRHRHHCRCDAHVRGEPHHRLPWLGASPVGLHRPPRPCCRRQASWIRPSPPCRWASCWPPHQRRRPHGAADKAADLLLCQDPAEAARLARELCALNRERQAVEQTIYAQAVEQIDHLPPQERSALVLASDTWHQGWWASWPPACRKNTPAPAL